MKKFFGLLVCFCVLLYSADTLFAANWKQVFSNKPTKTAAKNSARTCPDKKIGSPKTAEATFLGTVEEGAVLAKFRFDNGKTDLIQAGKMYNAVSKLKKGSKVSVTYQEEQFWSDEGDGGCIKVQQIQSIKKLH